MIRTASLIALFAWQAQATDRDVVLQPDQAVTLRLGSAATVVSEREAAEWTPYEVVVARQFAGGAFDHAVGANAAPLPSGGSIPEPRPIQPGAVRLRFLNVADQHSLLVIENGYGLALRYRAAITRGNRGATTDVCIVLPNRRGMEHWPYRIDRLIVSDFRLEARNQSDGVTCQ